MAHVTNISLDIEPAGTGLAWRRRRQVASRFESIRDVIVQHAGCCTARLLLLLWERAEGRDGTGSPCLLN